VYTYDPSTWETKAEGLQAQGQSGLHEILSQKKKIQNKAITIITTLFWGKF
jgi:hypothetical protein